LAANGSKELVTPIIVGGKVVSYSPHRDNGHAFRTRSRSVSTSVREGYHYRFGTKFAGGPYTCNYARVSNSAYGRAIFPMSSSDPRMFMGSLPFMSDQPDLVNYGKKAIVILAPGFPDVSLFVSVGELLSAFPKFIGVSAFEAFAGSYLRSPGDTLKRLSKGSADEFLNYVFGILPTIEDAKSIVDAMNNATNTLLYWEKNSGKGIRRKMKFDISHRMEHFPSGDLDYQGEVSNADTTFYFGGTQSYSGSGSPNPVVATSSSLTQSSIRRVAFTGSFSRFLPTHPGLAEKQQRFMQEFDLVYGSAPNFERLWELIPFSWLVDWFLDIQWSLRLLDRVHDESLVINYGYVTGLTMRSVVQRSKFTWAAGQEASFSNVSSSSRSLIKQRVRANYSGFITPDEIEINPLKVGIGIAIGLSGQKPN